MVRVGKIAATHGLQGTLVLTHSVGKSTWVKPGMALFVALQRDSRIPFFVVTEKALTGEEYHVRLEDVVTVEEARVLVGKEVFVDASVLEKSGAETPLRWIGYSMVDKTRGALGLIEDVYQAGAQWLAKLTWDGREVLIPLVDAFVLDVNTRNRFIRVELPEGLLEL